MSLAFVLFVLPFIARADDAVPVTMSMMPAGEDWYSVSVLFPDMPEVTQAQSVFQDLTQRTGWSATEVKWDVKQADANFPAQTSVNFMVRSPFPNGRIPLESLALTFRAYRELNVMIAHGGAFQYQGKPRYETEDVTIDALSGPSSLAVHIVIRNPEIQRLDLPGALTHPDRAKRAGSSLPVAGMIFLAMLFAAAVWVLVYFVMISRRPKGTPPAP